MTFVIATRHRIEVLIARMVLRNAHIGRVGEVVRIITIGIVAEALPILQGSVRIGERGRFDDRTIGGNAILNARARRGNANARARNADAASAQTNARAAFALSAFFFTPAPR